MVADLAGKSRPRERGRREISLSSLAVLAPRGHDHLWHFAGRICGGSGLRLRRSDAGGRRRFHRRALRAAGTQQGRGQCAKDSCLDLSGEHSLFELEHDCTFLSGHCVLAVWAWHAHHVAAGAPRRMRIVHEGAEIFFAIFVVSCRFRF
jgi:hypothetical protein